MTAPLLQVVPDLPPSWEGVGCCAATLAGALARRGTASHFLVAAPSWSAASASVGDVGAGTNGGTDGGADGGTGGAPAEAIGARSAGALARRLETAGGDTLLLHYVNYAYERRGCPFWLVDGALAWRRRGAGRRLVTFFHELYAGGPPWRSSFWLHPVQRRLARRLARGSDALVTSLGFYAALLARWRPPGPVEVAPIPSTIGEPRGVPPLDARRPRTLVVFGSRGNRWRAYGELGGELVRACRALGIAEVLDVGHPIGGVPAALGGAPVRQLGPLPDAAASAVLLGAFAGFIGYPAPLLGKSSVFAAYCAHGLLPVTAWRGRLGLRVAGAPTPPSWNAGAQPPPGEPAALAALARAWYAEHDLESQAAALHALLGRPADLREAAP